MTSQSAQSFPQGIHLLRCRRLSPGWKEGLFHKPVNLNMGPRCQADSLQPNPRPVIQFLPPNMPTYVPYGHDWSGQLGGQFELFSLFAVRRVLGGFSSSPQACSPWLGAPVCRWIPVHLVDSRHRQMKKSHPRVKQRHTYNNSHKPIWMDC